MGDAVTESNGSPESSASPQPQTDPNTDMSVEMVLPLVYPTFEDWRRTLPKPFIDNSTLEQLYDSYQRLVMLLSRLSAKESTPGAGTIPWPSYAVVPSRGRPVDVARATEDFVDSQDWQHDIRVLSVRLSKLEASGNPEEVEALTTRIRTLKEAVSSADENFKMQGLHGTVLLKEFTIMKRWIQELRKSLEKKTLTRNYTSMEEMEEVLRILEKSIPAKESQLVEEGILPLTEAPQTAKRLAAAANILTTKTGGDGGQASSPGQLTVPIRRSS